MAMQGVCHVPTLHLYKGGKLYCVNNYRYRSIIDYVYIYPGKSLHHINIYFNKLFLKYCIFKI